jgi:hypothetical protein
VGGIRLLQFSLWCEMCGILECAFGARSLAANCRTGSCGGSNPCPLTLIVLSGELIRTRQILIHCFGQAQKLRQTSAARPHCKSHRSNEHESTMDPNFNEMQQATAELAIARNEVSDHILIPLGASSLHLHAHATWPRQSASRPILLHSSLSDETLWSLFKDICEPIADLIPHSQSSQPLGLPYPSSPTTQQPVPAEVEDPFAVISNNKPGFKYKYPQADPTPPGEDDVVWNKVYTAADSRMYNKHHKNANESRKYRDSGETRALAIRMLAENKEKHAKAVAAAKAAGVPLSAIRATPKAATMPPKKKEIKKEASTSSRDGTPGGDTIPMSISEKIKSEGRARKAPPAAAPSSSQGSPAPPTMPKQGTPSASTKQGTLFSGPQMNSPVPEKASPVPPSKVQRPAKKGTATTVKKQHAKKAKADGMSPR